MLRQATIGVVVVVLAFAGFVSTRTNEYRVERTTTIGREPPFVFAIVRDFNHFKQWSPWQKLDPDMSTAIIGIGKGSSYEWHGNDDVGNGKMVVIEELAPSRIVQSLKFLPPWEADAITGFDLAESGSGTKVTWWMTGEFDFLAKSFDVFVPMDSMIGEDYAKGLASLKAYVESNPSVQASE